MLGKTVSSLEFKRDLTRQQDLTIIITNISKLLVIEEKPVKLSHNEEIKEAIPTLAGTIASTIDDASADHFTEDDNQFLKFHGSYQQDDRDLRKTGKKYIMMVRGRIPGGVMTAGQWTVFDDLASRYGNNTLRITTRQSIQFHGIVMRRVLLP